MAGRRQSLVDEVFDLLKLTPTWFGPILAAGAFASFRFLIPLLLRPGGGPIDAGILLRQLMPLLAWFAAGAILFVWLMAEFRKLSERSLRDRQTGIESVRRLSWKDFERGREIASRVIWSFGPGRSAGAVTGLALVERRSADLCYCERTWYRRPSLGGGFENGRYLIREQIQGAAA